MQNTPESAERRLGAVAHPQHGVFSRKQAIEAGVSASTVARRVASGAWVRVLPGVYRSAGTPESWRQRLAAACVWGGKDGFVSHLSAARLHDLEGLPSMKQGEPVDLTILSDHVRGAPGIAMRRSRTLGRADRSIIDGIPVTSLARTLIDISPELDEKHLCMAIDSGLAVHRSCEVGSLRRELRRLQAKGRRIAPSLGRLLAERAPDANHLDSVLERRFAAALREARLPKPVEHYDVVEQGRRIAELDFAYPRVRLGIQLNGASIHRRHGVWERDQEQLSELAIAGWRIVLVTWAQLERNEAAVMRRVARALGALETAERAQCGRS